VSIKQGLVLTIKEEQMKTRPDISLTFAKGLKILKALELSERDVSIADVANMTDMDRATARRLVLTLEQEGYVRKIGKQFRITPKILTISGGFLQSRQITKSIVPILNQFSSDLGTPIYLAMRDDYNALYLAHAALENNAVSLGLTIGSRVPILSTSIGRALLIATEPAQIQDILKNAPLTKITPDTITNRQQLEDIIINCMKDGYAFSDNEFELGVAGLAMPFMLDGPFTAGIGIASERENFDYDFKKQVVRTLRACRNHLNDVIKLL